MRSRLHRTQVSVVGAVLASALVACSSGGASLSSSCADFIALDEAAQLELAREWNEEVLRSPSISAFDSIARNQLVDHCSVPGNGEDIVGELRANPASPPG